MRVTESLDNNIPPKVRVYAFSHFHGAATNPL
jgi:hypothetical protein